MLAGLAPPYCSSCKYYVTSVCIKGHSAAACCRRRAAWSSFSWKRMSFGTPWTAASFLMNLNGRDDKRCWGGGDDIDRLRELGHVNGRVS